MRGRWLYRDLGKSIPGERNTAQVEGSQFRFLVNEVEAEVGLLDWDHIVTPARSWSVDHGKGWWEAICPFAKFSWKPLEGFK